MSMIHKSDWHGERKPFADVAGVGDEPFGGEAPPYTKDDVGLRSIADAVDGWSGVTGTAEAEAVNEETKPGVSAAEASEQPRQEVGPFAVEKGDNLVPCFQESLCLVFPNIQLQHQKYDSNVLKGWKIVDKMTHFVLHFHISNYENKNDE